MEIFSLEIYLLQNRIRYKWGSEENEKWTNMQLEPEMGKISTSLFTSVGKVIFRLTSTDVGYVWSITKVCRLKKLRRKRSNDRRKAYFFYSSEFFGK